MTVRRLLSSGFIAGVLAFAATACDDPVAPTDHEAIFQIVWEDFDRTDPFFAIRGTDWSAERTRLLPQAAAASGPRDLFDVLRELLLGLEDVHVHLQAPTVGRAEYTAWRDVYPEHYDPQVVDASHLDGPLSTASSGTLAWGRIEDDIGYVRIPSFVGAGHGADFAEALTALSGAAGLILDVRSNGGGDDRNGRDIAARFADQRRLFRRIQVRNGPAHDAFGPPEDDFIEPGLEPRDPRPVVVLTNRWVFSSAETFVLAMRVLPGVTVVGDTTGGASANPASRILPNGWRYTVSRWLVTTPSGSVFEGRGLAPDVWQSGTPDAVAAGRDAMVDRAVEILRAAAGAPLVRGSVAGSPAGPCAACRVREGLRSPG